MRKVAYFIVKKTYYYLHVFVLFLQKILGVGHQYQPSILDKKIVGRDSYDRLQALMDKIDKPIGSLIDLGCNRGFFVLQLAQEYEQCLAIGVDSDKFEVINARAVAEKKVINNAVFVEKNIDENFVSSLPNFDLVICLSIFHHWVRIYGKEAAFSLMHTIAEKSDTYLLFETGQFNETKTSWHDKLDFMGDNPKQWIHDFLKQLGFSQVLELGEYQTTLSPIKRTLFLAIKAQNLPLTKHQ